MSVLIDGVPIADPVISVFDAAVLRGDGCFEAIRSYNGRPFRVDDHLDRMERSASMLELSLPDRDSIASWIEKAADEGGDGIIRVVLTRGGPDPGLAPARTIVLWEPLPEMPDELRLAEIMAPWHSAGADYELAGAKWLSYAPNMAATRAAQRAGFDDAVLISREKVLLEGPTYSVAWAIGGVLETPSLDLGILASVTRRVILELVDAAGIEVVEGLFKTERLAQADEVLALSTIKEITPVVAVGDRQFAAGPLTRQLAELFSKQVERELA